MKDQWRRSVLAALTVIVHLGAPGAVLAQSVGKQVLVLYSTRPDAQLSIVGESELPPLLEGGLSQRVVYHSEFMDVATFPERAHVALHEFLRLKYEGIRFDLVVAIQNEAIEFVDVYRDTLFRDTPAVFLANDPASHFASVDQVVTRALTGALAVGIAALASKAVRGWPVTIAAAILAVYLFANAVYTYAPNFANGDYKEGAVDEDESHVTFEFYTPFIIACSPANPKEWGIYDPGGKNGLVLHGKAACPVSINP